MSYLIVIPHLRVENANAISGLTYGFPAMTHFLGFTHALSRKTQTAYELTLSGCGVVCHQQQIQAYRPNNWSDYSFALTRNPLTKEAKTAAFNEEGRMHMTVTLFIKCQGSIAHGDAGSAQVADFLQSQCVLQRLAGGTIVSVGKVRVMTLPEGEEALTDFTRREMYRALPGYALVDRSEYLAEHFSKLQQQNPNAEMLDAWLDFAALKTHAIAKEGNEQPQEGDEAQWEYLPKPQNGYLVPLMVGYRAISPVYAPGEVDKTRDPSLPFCFAEALYGVGEWRSPHRIKDINQLFWHYQHDDGRYLCGPQQPVTEENLVSDDYLN